MLPPELFPLNPSWWCPILAALFTSIDLTGALPRGWTSSVVVPIHKKGNAQDPNNYRPISLLDVPAKLYARHLLEKLEQWVEEFHILSPLQAGFRKGHSTIDQCFVLNYLIQKYANNPPRKLYVAFVDLSSAFDSIDRQRLWNKLQALSIEKRLLSLIQHLYSNTDIKIRYGIAGSLSDPILTSKGVKQGCILAPLLFNLYINDITQKLYAPTFFPPTIGKMKVPALLYADDMALISLTQVGMRRLLTQLGGYCKQEGLTVNYNKTKVVVFAKRHVHHRWILDAQVIEQTRSFKYLGLHFSENTLWHAHIKAISSSSSRLLGPIKKLYYTKGHQLVEPTVKVYVAKIIAHLLYGAPMWGAYYKNELEPIQNNFLCTLLAVAHNMPGALLRTEIGIPSLRARVHKSVILYMKKLCQMPEQHLQDREGWVRTGRSLMSSYSPLSVTTLHDLPVHHIRDIIFSNDIGIDLEQVRKCKLAIWYPKFKQDHKMASYLKELTFFPVRRAFTQLRFQQMPTELLKGRYDNCPVSERLCICGAGQVEDLAHYVLHCHFYKSPRTKFILPFLNFLEGHTEEFKIRWLLADTDNFVSYRVALFALAALKLRRAFVAGLDSDLG